MTQGKLNEETIKRLPIPDKGNRIAYFAGDIIQGAKVPRGFQSWFRKSAQDDKWSFCLTTGTL